MSGTPYLASEDSALLRMALGKYSGGSCLEIGAGNGGNLVDLSNRFDLVVGTDLVRPAMSDWKAGANFVLADSASSMRGSTFDLVAFNPPYIAVEASGDIAVEGGRDLEIPKLFLQDALRAVRKGGAVVFLLGEDGKREEFERICAEQGFTLRRLQSRRVFFEELSVYEATQKG
jgi:methylase of polypeptide subunit release factors